MLVPARVLDLNGHGAGRAVLLLQHPLAGLVRGTPVSVGYLTSFKLAETEAVAFVNQDVLVVGHVVVGVYFVLVSLGDGLEL